LIPLRLGAVLREFERCRARPFCHSAWHAVRTVARRMAGVARPDATRTVSPERGVVRPIPGDGRQP
jgi:hypothetical protein